MTALMSQRKHCRDKACVKESVTPLNTEHSNSHSGGWRRRSLFSSERLDLILSNLRRDLGKSVDGVECKQLSDGVGRSRDAPRHHSDHRCHRHHLQQQQQRGTADVDDWYCKQKPLTLNGHFSTENTTNAGGDVQSNDKSDNAAELTQNVAESWRCYADDRCDASRRHGDVAQLSADSAQGNPSDGCRIKKSVSFRAEPKLLSCDADGDKHVISRLCRRASRQQQHNDQQHASIVTSPPSCQTSHKTAGLDRDRPTVRTVLRDCNKQHGSDSRQTLSKGTSKRSKSAGGLKTRGSTDMEKKLLNSNGSWSSGEHQQCPASERHQRHPTSINWYVDVADSDNTEFRPQPHTSPTSSLSQNQTDCRTGVGSKSISVAVNEGYKLEQASFKRTTWAQSSGGRGRATTRLMLDQLQQPTHTRHGDAIACMSSMSAPGELGQTASPLQRTWSTKANRTSERRTGGHPHSDGQARPSISSQFRRSMVATRPKYKATETFVDTRSVAQPAEHNCESKITRSVSLSERYRMLIDGDWIEKFAASPVDVGQQKPTSINGLHKPLALPRELKPDFVIYV